MNTDPNDGILRGIPVFPGVVYGEFVFAAEPAPAEIPHRTLDPGQTEDEWLRFEAALHQAEEELRVLRDGGGKEQREILDAQLLMLSDPEFLPLVRREMEERRENAEAALDSCVKTSVLALRAAGDAFLAARAADIEDAFGRVMAKLLHAPSVSGADHVYTDYKGKILAARNLSPSAAVALRNSGIAALVTEEGGAACHVAVLAKSWKIPAVTGVSGLSAALHKLPPESRILLDGSAGRVVTGLSPQEAEAYAQSVRPEPDSSGPAESLPSATADGTAFTLLANIALPEECAGALAAGTAGVGLFRSEFLFLQENGFSPADEEKQFQAYRMAAEAAGGRPVTIRTLDVGGDKPLAEQSALREKNPLLGWRALRFCLARRDVFQAQLRAILRASAFGRIQLMFPMVASCTELEAALSALEEAKLSCVKDGFRFDPEIRVGVMIEIPSAAVCADLFARRVSFLSVGTNDLTQYTMAADRENPQVAYLYDCFEPGVLRLLRHVIQCGAAEGAEVSVCGEMAGDPLAACLLFGLGLRKFSMSSVLAAAVARALSAFSSSVLADAAEKALACAAGTEARSVFQTALQMDPGVYAASGLP